MADVMSERMEQVSRAATERLLATQRDLAAARADAAKLRAALEWAMRELDADATVLDVTPSARWHAEYQAARAALDSAQ